MRTGRPFLLLLHGFPELAYSWRKVMVPLGAPAITWSRRISAATAAPPAGTAPTTAISRSFRMLKWCASRRRSFGARLPLGRGGGRPRLRLAGRGLVRADAAGRVPRGAHERAVPGPAAIPFDTAATGATPPRRAMHRRHPRRSGRAAAPAQALPMVLFNAGPANADMCDCAAGHPRLPARLLPSQERRLEGEQAAPLAG